MSGPVVGINLNIFSRNSNDSGLFVELPGE
jgi:hypothetical protein